MNVKRLATHDVLRHVLPCHEFVSQGLAGPVMSGALCGARDEIRPDNERSAALLLLIFTDPFKDYTNSQVSQNCN